MVFKGYYHISKKYARGQADFCRKTIGSSLFAKDGAKLRMGCGTPGANTHAV